MDMEDQQSLLTIDLGDLDFLCGDIITDEDIQLSQVCEELEQEHDISEEKAVRKYKQPCDDILKKVSAVLEPIPGVAKSLEKRKREDDMETDTDLPCRPTKTLRSFGSDITNAKNGQYFQNCNISFNF
uniref:Uncharacterized protein n=1 Tax=Magallana gigas TaxID=29159 RepID=A0A8W8J837_MAGGI